MLTMRPPSFVFRFSLSWLFLSRCSCLSFLSSVWVPARSAHANVSTRNSYWTYVLMNVLRPYQGEVSIRIISNMTAIKTEDIISTLQSLNLIRYWKGQHVIAVSRSTIDDCLSKSSRFKLCRPECLTWPVEVED